jgi:hypothetical protein
MRTSQVFAFRLLPVLERLCMGVHVRQAIIVFHKPPMYVNNVEFIRLGLAVILVSNSNTPLFSPNRLFSSSPCGRRWCSP